MDCVHLGGATVCYTVKGRCPQRNPRGVEVGTAMAN